MDGRSRLEQARADHPGQSDAVLVEQLAADLGAELDLEPPVDLSLVASAQGIGRIEHTDLPWSGCLLAEPSGLVMRIRATDYPRRQRFTGFHEVSHTLLPGFVTTSAAYRCTPGDDKPEQQLDRQVEHLADVAASEFLLPRRHVAAEFRDSPFGWDTIIDIADNCEASLEATARRFVALSEKPTILIALKLGTSTTDAAPKLRVASRSYSGVWPYVPINKSVPADHPLSDAAQGAVIDETTDLSCLTGVPLVVRLSARPYPYYDDEGKQVMRILALATPESIRPNRAGHRA